MEELLETVRALAEIGPRLPTSAEEAQAAAYINSKMRASGLDVEVQTFRAVPTYLLPMAPIYLALILTPLVYRYSPPAALGMSLVALVLFVAEMLSYPVLSSWFPGGKSQNVIGTRPAAQEACQHLIVLAHMDSSRARLFFHPRLVGGFRRFFLLLVAAITALPILAGLGWWLGEVWFWYGQWLPAGLIALFFLLVVVQELFLPPTVGANDNASGVAVLLQLARELEGLQRTSLWLVATGAHGAGLHGVRRFLRRFPFPRRDTYIVNLDSLGRGELAIIVREGMLLGCRADPHLVELAGQAEAADISIDADPRTYHLLNTDAQVPLMRRFRAISVMALEKGHPAGWPADTAEQVQPQLLGRATRLVLGLAQRLDRAAAPKEAPREEEAALPSQEPSPGGEGTADRPAGPETKE